MYATVFGVQALALSQSSLCFLGSNCFHYLNQTLVVVVNWIFKTFFNYI